MSRRAELDAFLGWVLGVGSQAGAVSFGTARSFRRRTAWCWNIAPAIPATGEIHDQVQIDGIYVGSWCCLIAIAGEYVIGWQWCDTEKKAAWAALLQRFPAPRVVITDGGSGIAAALSDCWSDTAVQRCLVHVQRNVRTHLTSRPRTEAGKALLRLARALTRISTPAQAAAWLGHLNDWHQDYGQLVRARTYRSTNDQTTLTIFSCIRVSLRFVHIVNGHHAAKLTVFVNNQNLLDTVFAQQVTNFIFIHTLFNRHQTIFRCHDGSNRCIQMIFKTQVAAGDDTNQIIFGINNRETGHPVALLQGFGICQGLIRFQGDRVVDNTGHKAFDAPHLLGLFFGVKVLMDNTHPTGLGHGNGHARLCHRIHRGT